MPQNLKNAIIAVAFAVFAIAGYQIIYKEGIWKPNISTRSAIDDALARADRVTASEARKDLDDLLSRAEKGERLDRAELERLIKAAATDAGNLDALWKEAETKSKGQIVAPPPQSVPAAQPLSPNGPTGGPVTPPRNYSPAHQRFFDRPFQFGHSTAQWTRVESPPDLRAFSIEVGGMTPLGSETKNQLSEIGPKGVSPDQMRYGFDAKDMVEPTFPYLALMGRVCSQDGCGRPFVFPGNPWYICLAPETWFEMRLNINFKGRWETSVFGLSFHFRREYFCDDWKGGQ